MNIVFYLLLLVEITVSFLLIGVILIQKPKAQGAGLAFGAGMGESIFGSQMGNVLTRATVVLAIAFLINTTALVMLGGRRTDDSVFDRVAAPVASGPAPSSQPAAPVMPADDTAPLQWPSEPVAEPSAPVPDAETAEPPPATE